MPYISYDDEKDSIPIAIAYKPIIVKRNGSNVLKPEFDKTRIVYLSEKEPSDEILTKSKPLEIDMNEFKKDFKGLNAREMQKLVNKMYKALSKNVNDMYDETDYNNNIYRNIKKKHLSKIILDKSGEEQYCIMPSEDPEKPDTIYTSGAGGAGKSHTALLYALCYKKLYPKNNIFLISKLEKDTTIDQLGKALKRINPVSLYTDPIDINSGFFNDSLIIFDDYDSFNKEPIEDETTKKIVQVDMLKIIRRLMDDLLTMHRHLRCTMIIASHMMSDYKNTKLIFNEASHICLFPNACSPKGFEYILMTHGGLSKKQVEECRKLGRWVCLRKGYPPSLISPKEVRLVHDN